jgi:hypothetical protein
MLYALQAAAWQPTWAGCGELDGADHLYALLAAVRRLAAAGFGLLRGDTVHSTLTHYNDTSTFPYHNSTPAHQLTHSSSGFGAWHLKY